MSDFNNGITFVNTNGKTVDLETKLDSIEQTIESIQDGTIAATNAKNVSSTIAGKAITDIFEKNGTTVKNATNATTADNASSMINGKAISDIFESNGTTAKTAARYRVYLRLPHVSASGGDYEARTLSPNLSLPYPNLPNENNPLQYTPLFSTENCANSLPLVYWDIDGTNKNLLPNGGSYYIPYDNLLKFSDILEDVEIGKDKYGYSWELSGAYTRVQCDGLIWRTLEGYVNSIEQSRRPEYSEGTILLETVYGTIYGVAKTTNFPDVSAGCNPEGLVLVGRTRTGITYPQYKDTEDAHSNLYFQGVIGNDYSIVGINGRRRSETFPYYEVDYQSTLVSQWRYPYLEIRRLDSNGDIQRF